jgi:hypothetical protein
MKNRSHRFGGVIEHAVQVKPTTYRALVNQTEAS